MYQNYKDDYYDNGGDDRMETDYPSDEYSPLENIWDNPIELDEEDNKLSIEQLLDIIDSELKKQEYLREARLGS